MRLEARLGRGPLRLPDLDLLDAALRPPQKPAILDFAQERLERRLVLRTGSEQVDRAVTDRRDRLLAGDVVRVDASQRDRRDHAQQPEIGDHRVEQVAARRVRVIARELVHLAGSVDHAEAEDVVVERVPDRPAGGSGRDEAAHRLAGDAAEVGEHPTPFIELAQQAGGPGRGGIARVRTEMDAGVDFDDFPRLVDDAELAVTVEHDLDAAARRRLVPVRAVGDL